MKLYNFLSRKVEEFKPIDDNKVGLYTCGPTVYDYVHIGNWRTFIFEDILKRVLQFNGYDVVHVMNLTDIDDKIIKRAGEEKVDFLEIGKKYERAFMADLSKVNILKADEYPRATNYITSMIRIIEVLLEKGVAYKGDDGIYFAVEKFPDYGKLSGLEKRELKKGARVKSDQYDKENWSDFALWKFPQPSSSPGLEPGWDAPFGRGRPGWHIECSAMSIAKLGESFDPSTSLRVDRFKTIDIHTGGVDLLFPHHENEIAQSEAATGVKFVNYWLEGEHLLVDGEKMSKSLNNFYKIEDIVAKGFDPLALRYLFLTAHYRSKLNFTWESLEAAQNALLNIREAVSDVIPSSVIPANAGIHSKKHWILDRVENDKNTGNVLSKFKDAINNDLNMPEAVAALHELLKSNLPNDEKYETILQMDMVFGLALADAKPADLPVGAQHVIDKREEFRKAGNFEESDKLRQELLEMGVEVKDTPDGTKWKVKK